MAYQGWENYETWNIALRIGNDEGMYAHVRDLALAAWDESADPGERTYLNRKERATFDLADQIKSMIEEDMPDVQGLYRDILLGGLQSANYKEIAKAQLEDLEGYDDEDDGD